MPIIYEPRGAALEYAPLAANLYRGCAHRCSYCYAPACLRMDRDTFHGCVSERAGVIAELRKDARKLRPSDTVLLCFTCDPYQEIESRRRLTRQALEILLPTGCTVRILTKDPARALELDGHLLHAHAGQVEFGSTVLFVDDTMRAEYEPGAPSIASRLLAMRKARDAGLWTYISLEPVIDPGQALALLREHGRLVDCWKIGRWNHDPRANAIDWQAFGRAIMPLLRELGVDYYIKNEPWKAAGLSGKGFPKERAL